MESWFWQTDSEWALKVQCVGLKDIRLNTLHQTLPPLDSLLLKTQKSLFKAVVWFVCSGLRLFRCDRDNLHVDSRLKSPDRLDSSGGVSAVWLTVIWLSPASLMVSVGDMKYLKARSRLSLSKHSALSSGSFTVLHIRSAMLRAALCRSSWSDSLHRYLQTASRIRWAQLTDSLTFTHKSFGNWQRWLIDW